MIRSIPLAVLLHVVWISVSSNNIEGLVTGFTCTQIHAGDTAVIRFNSSISSTSGLLFMRITLGDGPDILDCFRNETQSQPVCTIYNPRFQSNGLVDDQLSLVIKNTTRDLQGLYVLRVAFNNTQYAVSCNLEFLGTTGGTTQHGGAVSNVTLIAAITPSILVLCCALGLLFIARKRIKYDISVAITKGSSEI
ncbi:hypothetical protein V1264_017548 [Littorina saxatilis]|uniref:Immunoglobulin subtype domain-containing protein n=2 Tax=Littorina saxatilis TaxID=31220 RepID=A0AAN9GFW0_9CAEN